MVPYFHQGSRTGPGPIRPTPPIRKDNHRCRRRRRSLYPHHPHTSNYPHIFDAFENRANLVPVQDRVRGHRIAIIGLGGTGSYILDLVVKTPVAEIHLLDADRIEGHNLMRAPGAPTAEEREAIGSGELFKVEYYRSKYETMRPVIHPHAVRVDSEASFMELAAKYSIDFVFICIDQATEGGSPRQDMVYRAVAASGVPFIDSGVSITVKQAQVTGSITANYFDGGSDQWAIVVPSPQLQGDVPGYYNVQLPEVNATAAALAVMEWRRRTGQYAMEESAPNTRKLRLETGRVLSSQTPA